MPKLSKTAGAVAALIVLSLGAACTSTKPAQETAAAETAQPAPAAKASSGESALNAVGFCSQSSSFGGCQKKRQPTAKKLTFATPSSASTPQKPREQEEMDQMDVQP